MFVIILAFELMPILPAFFVYGMISRYQQQLWSQANTIIMIFTFDPLSVFPTLLVWNQVSLHQKLQPGHVPLSSW